MFALLLSYFMTGQQVGRREIFGAVTIVAGLALFVSFGDPAGGRDDAPTDEWLLAIFLVAALCGALLFFGRGGNLSVKAGVYGTAALAGAVAITLRRETAADPVPSLGAPGTSPEEA